MIVLQMSNLEKSFGSELIFKSMTLEAKTGETIGIVGKNGTGKTTLMKIMAGELDYDAGHFHIPKTVNIGYLTQQMTLESSDTVYSEMKKPFQDLLNTESKLKEITTWLSQNEDTHPEYEAQLKRYDTLHQTFESNGGYLIDAKIKAVLTGLNFSLGDLNETVDTFSGGQKTRLALGQILLNEPELLLLDEPTNHLDMETVRWLEGYLKSFNGAIIIISHDRYFLDAIVSKIYEIELGRGTLYHTNYTKYLVEKEARYARDLKAYERQQKEIKRLETFVEKNIARASTSGMAKSRRKQLEHMELMEAPNKDTRRAKLRFTIERETGNDVLKLQNVAVGYHSPIKENISFNVSKQDRIAIVGSNGIGKSTLLKTIAKHIPVLTGEVFYGSNVNMGYYDQKQAEFTSNKTVLEELWNDYPHMNETDVRTVLGQFLFTQDEVLKSINDLSGGEKARIQLIKLMLEQHNVLLLDEPTNHLDITSKEVLEEALEDYDGTIIVISHDRYFINRIANKIIEIDEVVSTYNGDYEYYVHKKEEKKALEANTQMPTTKKVVSNNYHDEKKARNEISRLKREYKENENELLLIEEQINQLETLLTTPEVFNDYEKAAQINEELNQQNNRLETMMLRQEEIEESIYD